MKKLNTIFTLASGFFALLTPFKSVMSQDSALALELGESQKKLELKHELISETELNTILDEGIENLSAEEKDVLILKLLDISNKSLHMQTGGEVLNEEYLNDKGVFSFKG